VDSQIYQNIITEGGLVNLTATENIAFHGTVSTGGGSLSANARGIHVYQNIYTNSGDLNFSADMINVSKTIYTDGGLLSLTATGDIILNDLVNTNGGAFSATADSDNNGSGKFTLAAPTTDSWVEQQIFSAWGNAYGDPRFGYSVAIDGNTAIIGAPYSGGAISTYNHLSGAAYIFTRIGDSWIQEAKLTASDVRSYAYFGCSVAIDGDTVIVGSYGANDGGAAYIFTRSGTPTVWTQQARLTAYDAEDGDGFGWSVSIDGDTVIVGAPYEDYLSTTDKGSAYVFNRSGTTGAWSDRVKFTYGGAQAYWHFGWSVSLSGTTALIGSPGTFAVPVYGQPPVQPDLAYIFDPCTDQGEETYCQTNILTGAPHLREQYFGYSVALDGETGIVGAPRADLSGDDYDEGAVSFITRDGTTDTWTQGDLLDTGNNQYYANLGTSVSLSGDTAFVGAHRDTFDGHYYAGSTSVFSRNGTEWNLLQILTASNAGAGNHFGHSVSVDGDAAIIGAYNTNRAFAFRFVPGTRGGTIITFGGDISITAAHVELLNGGVYAFSGDVTITGRNHGTISTKTSATTQITGGTITLDGHFKPGGHAAPGNVSITGSLVFATGSSASFDINGDTPIIGYDRLSVSGTTDLNSLNLDTSASTYTPSGTEKFTLIGSYVTPYFNGLAEGATVDVNGVDLLLTYWGGTGREVVLTMPSLFSINDVSISEGDSGSTTLNFAVYRNHGNNYASVRYYTSNDSASTADNDYQLIPSTSLSFALNEFTKTIGVTINGDTKVEADEFFYVRLHSAGRAEIFDNMGRGTITNDDSATLTLAGVDHSKNERTPTLHSWTGFTFSVTLDNAVQGGLDLAYTTNDGTATVADSDYVDNDSSLSFTGNAGESQTITVWVRADDMVEADETFTVALGAISNLGAGIDPNDLSTRNLPATGTILNEDTATLTLSGVTATQNEGNGGVSTDFTFSVTLDKPVQGGLDLAYATNDGTATVADLDYIDNDSSLSFTGNAGESKTITVQAKHDAKVEADEVFNVALGAISGLGTGIDSNDLSTAGAPASGTIINDDTATLTLAGVSHSKSEGSGGVSTDFTFSVTLDNPVQGGLSVAYTTEDDTATVADLDYIDNDGSLSFTGNAGESKPITVQVKHDAKVEADEVFNVALGAISNLGAGIDPNDLSTAGTPAAATITNDDSAIITLSGSSANEATGAVDFTVTMSSPVDIPVTLQFDSLSTGTATAGVDFTALHNRSVTFAAGDTSETVAVRVNDDPILEPDETIIAQLSSLNQGGRSVSLGGATPATILNDDTATLTLAGVNYSQNEGTGGTTTDFTFSVTLDNPVHGGLDLVYTTNDGTATVADLDYIDNDGSLSFTGNAGESKTITVEVKHDAKVEADEHFTVALGAISNLGTGIDPNDFSKAGAPATGTIINDDSAIITLSGSSANEATGAVDFTVTLSNPVDIPVSLQFDSLSTGTATAGVDFTALHNRSVSFAAGDTSEIMTITVKDDPIWEPDETITAQLSNLNHGGRSVSLGDVTPGSILNDDGPVLVSLDLVSGNLQIEDMAGLSDEITLMRDQANSRWVILDANNPIASAVPNSVAASATSIAVPFNQVSGSQITINLMAGADSLTVDFSDSSYTKAIHFNGGDPTGAPGDSLNLSGGSFTNATFNYTNLHDGSIDLDGQTITYTGLEPIVSTAANINVTLNYSAAPETITVQSGGADSTRVASTLGETTTFKNPTGILTVNAGDSGNDRINVTGLGANFSGDLVIDGQGGSDTVTLSNPLPVTTRSLKVIAESINLNSGSMTTTGMQTYDGPVTLGGDTALRASKVTFNSTLADTASSLIITGDAEFHGAVGGLNTLTISGNTKMAAGTVETFGEQTYHGAVTLGKDAKLIGSTIHFPNDPTSTIDGPFGLEIVGNANFQGPIGSQTPLAWLIIRGDTAMDAGTVSTRGGQDYYGPVRLSKHTRTNGAQMAFHSTVVGPGHHLTVACNGFFNDVIIVSSLIVCGTFTGSGANLWRARLLGGGNRGDNGAPPIPPPVIVVLVGGNPIIPVTGGQMVPLNQTTITILLSAPLRNPLGGLPPAIGDRDLVIFPPGIAGTAGINTELLDPANSILTLPDGGEVVSGLTVVLSGSQGPLGDITSLNEAIIISFAIPPALDGYNFSFLVWDPTMNNGLGGWVELEPVIMTWDPSLNNGLGGWVSGEEISSSFGHVPSPSESTQRLSVEVNFTGTFVLIAFPSETP